MIIHSYLITFNYFPYNKYARYCKFVTFWQPFWILAAILEIKENNFSRNRFLGLENIHLDLFHCFLRHLQAKICKILDFGGHLGKMADRKKCSTFGVWLQTDLDSAAQNLMETIIKVYICLKTRFSYQMLGSCLLAHQVCFSGCSSSLGIAKFGEPLARKLFKNQTSSRSIWCILWSKHFKQTTNSWSRAKSLQIEGKTELRRKLKKQRGKVLGRRLGKPLPRKFLKNETSSCSVWYIYVEAKIWIKNI